MTSDPSHGDLDEAREILFGDRERKLDSRISQLEAALASSEAESVAKIDAATKALTERIDEVTADLTGRIEALEAELTKCRRQINKLNQLNKAQTATGDGNTHD